MSRARIEGDDLDAVLAFAGTDDELRLMIGTITEAHAEWERFDGG